MTLEATNTVPAQTVPTMYFIGVTTRQSSIMRVFPRWAAILNLGARLVGYDAPLHADAAIYRTIVERIKDDPLSLGALVTTHKIDLFDATRDLFDYLDPHARICGEISCISKRGEALEGHAKDPITAGLAWGTFVPLGHFSRTGAEVLCFGAGGSATALSVFLAGLPESEDRPRRFVTVGRRQASLEKLRHIHQQLRTEIDFGYVLNEDPTRNDELMAALSPGSVVVNATGMGKDRPGSPITDSGQFPEQGIAWELNYRGALDFLRQARSQQMGRQLLVEDGWAYFLHGWTQVVAQVFHISLTPELFIALSEAAAGEMAATAPNI
jgi:shikimate 5-dehydrogenase